MPHFEDLGSALRTVRLRQEATQHEIAERAGISKAMLSCYENGKQLPALATLDKLLDALGIHLGTLHSLM